MIYLQLSEPVQDVYGNVSQIPNENIIHLHTKFPLMTKCDRPTIDEAVIGDDVWLQCPCCMAHLRPGDGWIDRRNVYICPKCDAQLKAMIVSAVELKGTDMYKEFKSDDGIKHLVVLQSLN